MKEQIKAVAIAFITLAIFLGVIWFFLDQAITSIARLQSVVAGTIIAAAIAAVAAFLVNVYVKHREAKERILQDIRAKKTAAYEELIDLIFSVIMAEKLEKKPTEAEMIAKFAKLTPKVVIWASPDVIRHWSTMRTYVKGPADTLYDQFAPWNELLRTIRKDLGHRDGQLERWALLRLFVNDLPPTPESNQSALK